MKTDRWKVRVTSWLIASAAIFGTGAETSFGVSLWDGLISYWKLDGNPNDTGPAGTVADTGVVLNGATWANSANGKFNAGLQFDGVSGQHMRVDSSTDMNIGTNYVTLSAWVKLNQLPSQMSGPFGGIYDSATDDYIFYLDKANKELRFKATTESGVSTAGANHPGIRETQLNTNDWVHVMGVYDGDAGTVKIYYNGQFADISTHTGGAGILGGPVRSNQVAGMGSEVAKTAPFDITVDRQFNGAISDVAVWNRPLGLSEAQYLYNAGVGNAVGAANPNINPLPPIAAVKPTAQPVVYYKFDGDVANYGTGGSALDAVVQGPNSAVFSSAGFGTGLDLTANPGGGGSGGVASTTGTGTHLAVNYKLTDNGTIAGRFTASDLYNFQTLWSNSSDVNDWESWVYADGRVAARADRGTSIVAYNLFQTGDEGASHHYAFNWHRDGAELSVQFFVDGELLDQRVGAWRDPGTTFYIGGGGGNHYGKGIYDEFRIYSSALTEAEILYLSQNAPETALIGDYNNDGAVDSADYNVWKSQYGSSGAQSADGNGDGVVNAADYTVWRDAQAAGSQANSVPEPTACAIGVVMAAIACCRRR